MFSVRTFLHLTQNMHVLYLKDTCRSSGCQALVKAARMFTKKYDTLHAYDGHLILERLDSAGYKKYYYVEYIC
jgi:hypothetical protein